jgi:hypothetical protein
MPAFSRLIQLREEPRGVATKENQNFPNMFAITVRDIQTGLKAG